MTPPGRFALALLVCAAGPVLAGEPTNVAWCPDMTSCLQWQPDPSSNASEFRLYRGEKRSLKCLANPAFDSCYRGLFFSETTGVALFEQPDSGSFFWYLVTELDSFGEGTRGLGAAGPRQSEPGGTCTFACQPPGSACSISADCCSASCIAGTCQPECCVELGGPCTQDADCCSGACRQGLCFAAGWSNGDFVTYDQDSWGGDPASSAAAALLFARFEVRFPTGIELGISGPTGFSMTFTSVFAVSAYLPATGGAGSLNNDLIDPTSSASGVLGGYLLSLLLDIVYSDGGDLSGTSGLPFGDLKLCGIDAMPRFEGMSVREFFDAVNANLGGTPYTEFVEDIANLTNDITRSFQNGIASPFAQQHLFTTECP